MATYIPGVTDYIPTIQPFQPDLNFFANVMQTRQTRYDAAKKKVNDQYGSLLYSPMLRDSNIKRREDFFKVIDEDIKKVSGMDLSLQQNVDQAVNVFKGFYDDKYMLNDMVKTKKLYSEIDKGKALKSCNDPEKCGGQYWDQGMQKLYYKMDEFKNVGDDEALNFEMGEYDAYYDWKKDATKKAKELGYEVKQDSLSGNWIVTDTNGKLVQGGLYSFFKSMYGDDPRVSSNYNTMAYVSRKNAAKAEAMTYGSEEESEKQYIMKSINSGLKDLNNNMKVVSNGYDQVNSRFLQLEKKKNTIGLNPKDKQAYDAVLEQKQYLEQSKTSLQSQIDDIQNNIDTNDINSLRQRADRSAAFNFENNDMTNLAKSLSEIKKERTIKANPFAEIAARASAEKELARFKAGLDLDKMKVEFGYKFKLEEIKQGIKAGDIPSAEGIPLEGAAWGNVDLGAVDKPDVGFQRSRTIMHKAMADAQNTSTAFLYNMFATAKNAFSTSKSAGAEQFLKQFGENWTNIKSPEEFKAALAKTKLTSISMFNSVVQHASSTKNPTGDYAWAQPLLQKSAAQIDMIKESNEAFHTTLDFNLKANKKVVDRIRASATQDNPVAKYADLLISSNGFLLADEQAPQSFITKYREANAKNGKYVSEGDAEDAYDALKEQFFTTYNSTPGVSIEQGLGLTGTGTLSAYPIEFKTLNSAQKSQELVDILNTTSKALSTLDHTVVIGDASKESFESGSNEAMKGMINDLINRSRTAKSNDKKAPVFNATVSPIAANDESLGAITFSSLPTDFIKDYTGSEKNPGPLYGADLSKGITVFYPKAEVKTPITKSTSPFETILKVKNNYRLDAFQDDAGVVDFSYDSMTGTAQGVLTAEYYQKGELKKGQKTYTFDIANADKAKAEIIATLQQIQATNLQTERAIEAANKR